MVQPRININVQSNFRLGGGILYATGAIIGASSWGDLGVVKTLTSFSDIKNLYKEGDLVKGAEQFFATGGRELKLLRIAGGTPVKASLNLVGGGNTAIVVTAKYEGTHGNDISIAVTENGSNRDIRVTSGSFVENFTDLADNDEIVKTLNGSQFVTATKSTNTLISSLTATNLTGGNNGDILTSADIVDALETKLWLVDFDYLILPGINSDTIHSSISAMLTNRSKEENKESILVTGGIKFEHIETTLSRNAINSEGRIVFVHSSLYIGNSQIEEDFNEENYLDATYTACAYAGMLCRLPVNTSPTFKSIGVLTANKLGVSEYTRQERANLINKGVTVITTTATGSFGPYMAVTRNGNEMEWTFMLDSVRKVSFMKSNLFNITKRYIGEPNDDTTRTSIKGSVQGFLESQVDDRIIQNYNLEVQRGTDPRAVKINAEVLLINEVSYIDISFILNI